jgi:cellulose synthase (UDP-forming)
MGSFWVWLLRPEHRVTPFGLIINCVLLAYLSTMPLYFLFAVNRLRGVAPTMAVPDLRVAFVVTKAPSEPWPMARRTLVAMLGQIHPHPFDVWLCDEDPSEETLTWCAGHGVRVSTRRGVLEYHRPSWPRRTRCKEGNLSYFYDRHGYQDYDVVAQLDCDHVPGVTYLTEMVRPFTDPAIGYVAAPSLCDSNAAGSWVARGRLYAEASFHGALQLGHHGLSPVCIGSHYAVRTAALKEIGGIGPELAEDFSTTFLLSSAGWQGAFAHQAEAHGEGPHTFAAMATQEFQWSRSLVTILLGLAPGHLSSMPWRLRARFVFALLYYPLFSVMTGLGLLLPPVAAVTGDGWLAVNYLEFLLRWCVVSSCLVAIHLVLRGRGLLRPRNPPVASWEHWMYVLAKWPFVARGVSAALLNRIRPRQIGFAVTPKQRAGLEALPTRLILPHAAIALLAVGSALIGENRTDAAGYVFLCLLSGTTYTIVTLAIVLRHAREVSLDAGVRLRHAVRQTVRIPLLVALLPVGPLLAGVIGYPGYAAAIFGWSLPWQ